MSKEKIFEQITKVKMQKDGMSFEGCPNKCRNGYYIDPYKHRRVRCEYCYDLRKKFVHEQVQVESGEAIASKLRLAQTLVGCMNYDSELVLPESRRAMLEPVTVSFVLDCLQGIMDRVSLGEPVGSSVLFNLGKHSHAQHFISPFLVRSYVSGLITAPRLTGYDIIRLRMLASGDVGKGLSNHYGDLTYDDVIAAETCVIYLDADSGDAGIMAAKGLMQLRGMQDRSTIIFADVYSEKIDELLQDMSDANMIGINTNTGAQSAHAVRKLVEGRPGFGKDLAYLLTVKYKTFSKQRKDDVASIHSGATLLSDPGANIGVG